MSLFSSAHATPSQKTARSQHFSLPMGSTDQNLEMAMDDKLTGPQADPNALSNLSLIALVAAKAL